MRFRGVHHVEFSVPNYESSVRFYDRMFGWLGYKSFWTLNVGYTSTYYMARFPMPHSYIGIQPAEEDRELDHTAHQVGGDGTVSASIQVVFDANSPYGAKLFKRWDATAPDTPVRWVPVAYLGKDSPGRAMAILGAKDSAAALRENAEHYDNQSGTESPTVVAYGKHCTFETGAQ